jgi:hypothetical protein
MFPSQRFGLLVSYEQHAQHAVLPHTKHHNHAQPVVMVPCSARHVEALSAIQKPESSIADYQDQDDVEGVKVNQIDLRSKMWDADKLGYHFCRGKVSQEE